MDSKGKFQKKLVNLRKELIRSEFEKTFWSRKVRYYAPNKIDEHYRELDQEWKEFCVRAMESEQNADNISR